MLDIVIPVYNEEKILQERREYFLQLSNKANLIFVDGGSDDRTANVARDYGEVIVSERGRGIQKNSGACACKGKSLLFLHVDTSLDDEALNRIEVALNNGIAGGCLTLKIDSHGLLFKVFENVVNFRAKKLGVFDGDLGFFIKKSVFDDTGGFDPIPVMEDILYSKRLRKVKANTVALPNHIIVSSRKWDNQGFIKTFIQYALAYCKYSFRV